MKINISTNSQKPIGALIEDLVAQADDVFVASAYISERALTNLLERCRPDAPTSLKSVDILFGMDLETDATALTSLLDASKAFPNQIRARYTPNKSGRLFHPKLYYFRCSQTSHIIIASANLTQRGHFANEEMYCHIECLASDPLVDQLSAIRQAWLNSPFSAPLDDKVVELKEQIAVATSGFNTLMKGGGGPIVIKPFRLDARNRLFAELEKGYLISTDFSVAPLSVSVPIREAQQGSDANGAVSIRTSLTASVQLLPDDTCNEFTLLYRKARKIVEQHSILVPPGLYYVPPSAQKSFSASVRALLNEHKQLIQKHIRLRRPINSHLIQLAADCTKAWQRYSNQPGIISQDEFLQIARKRIKERREEFRHKPQLAVRLTITPYPHPLIYRAQNPDHAIWDLSEASPDDDLLKTMLAILTAQVDLIIEAAQKKQQPAVQADLKQAKLLITVRGKAIDDLLVRLSRLAGKNWANATKRSKSKVLTPGKFMMLELDKLREQAENHKRLLESWKVKKPQEAFDLILQEYPSAGLAAA